MTATELALCLHRAGLRWRPVPGDRFFLPHRSMDDDVFVLSDMTVEIHEFPTGPVIGFNGVTEWALDSVDVDEAVWLPAENQLRDLLGSRFVSLRRDRHGFTVTVAPGADGRVKDHWSSSPADAYALALLAILEQSNPSGHGPGRGAEAGEGAGNGAPPEPGPGTPDTAG